MGVSSLYCEVDQWVCLLHTVRWTNQCVYSVLWGELMDVPTLLEEKFPEHRLLLLLSCSFFFISTLA